MVCYEVGDMVLCIFKGNNHLLNEFGDTHMRIFLYSLQDMKRKIREFAQRREHSRYDSCVVAIMSHGKGRKNESHGKGRKFEQNPTIISADGQDLEIEWILEQFNNKNAQSLARIPKIFFFQTCRCDMAFKLVIYILQLLFMGKRWSDKETKCLYLSGNGICIHLETCEI
jgi:hypothetical protein